MVTPITVDERRQLNTAGTIATSLLALFWLWAVASGNGRWPDLLLPVALLAMFVRALLAGRRPGLARWLQWSAIALVAGGALYAVTRVWGVVHHVSG